MCTRKGAHFSFTCQMRDLDNIHFFDPFFLLPDGLPRQNAGSERLLVLLKSGLHHLRRDHRKAEECYHK